MTRGKQLYRQWQLLKTLQTRGEGYSLAELGEHFGVSSRTLQRDIEMLREVGLPITYDEDDFGKRLWRLPYDFLKAGPLTLTLTEAVTLHLTEKLMEPLVGTHYADALDEIMAKLRQIMPRSAFEHFAGLDRLIHVRRTGLTHYGDYREVIRLLETSAHEEQSVKVTYKALGRPEPYTTLFDPYGLVYYDGDLFVIGRSHVAGAVRLFKVSRIQSAEGTGEVFKTPSGFDLEDAFRNSFGIFLAGGRTYPVTVRFAGIAADLVEERTWHDSQKTHHQPPEDTLFEADRQTSDCVVAKFGLCKATLVEFKRWIKGFGDLAEVLDPDWLRAELHEELKAAAQVYETDAVT